ncbi:hypothetical protein C8F01DRAFT_945551, partial [Mycena amicta]
CDIASSPARVLDLPANQTALVAPTTPPRFVTLGVGIQNYTCSSATSTYASIGAVASLFDLSCIEKKSDFATVQTEAFNIWNAPASVHASASSIGARVNAPHLLGFHYFVPSPSGTAGAINPKFDFSSTGKFKGDATAFIVAAKAGDILAPPPSNPTKDVDWLMLNGLAGLEVLATQVFRIDTVGGQPPSSCVPGTSAPVQVKYTAKYIFF